MVDLKVISALLNRCFSVYKTALPKGFAIVSWLSQTPVKIKRVDSFSN